MRFTEKVDDKNSYTIMQNKSLIGGIGKIERLVDLEKFYLDKVGQNEKYEAIQFYKGSCARCGYDRGIQKLHTEIEQSSVKCDNCESLIFDSK